jgi:hypothetical protein
MLILFSYVHLSALNTKTQNSHSTDAGRFKPLFLPNAKSLVISDYDLNSKWGLNYDYLGQLLFQYFHI